MLTTDRTIASRFECKYLVDQGAAACIRDMARQFMRPDPYAVNRRGHRYSICSLYLDSPALDLFRATHEGQRNRYKLRVRTYSDQPGTKLYFEIKQRSDQVVLKSRCAVDRALASSILSGDGPTGALPEGLARFRIRMLELAAEPILRVRYLREAYESRSNEPVRLTFDHDIQYSVTRSPDCSLGGKCWCRTPLDGIVVEIKFTDTCPLWVSLLIDRLQMMRESIPKYVSSLDDALSGARSACALAPLHRLDLLSSRLSGRARRFEEGGPPA